MAFIITYEKRVVDIDIKRLSTTYKNRIKRAIEDKLMSQPEAFGKPLRRSLRGYWKLRVGDYRVIFRIEKDIIKIFAIGHRSEVYKPLA